MELAAYSVNDHTGFSCIPSLLKLKELVWNLPVGWYIEQFGALGEMVVKDIFLIGLLVTPILAIHTRPVPYHVLYKEIRVIRLFLPSHHENATAV